jgi:hypothetical protein
MIKKPFYFRAILIAILFLFLSACKETNKGNCDEVLKYMVPSLIIHNDVI